MEIKKYKTQKDIVITPLISVIIPIYNVEKYLRRCLDSVVGQTFKDMEILCVDDESTDGSLVILEEFAAKDSRIKIIQKENGGVSSARNAGMRVAKGEYIGFLDSDDWIDLDFYEKLYAAAKKYDADSACASIKRPHASGRVRDKVIFDKEELLKTAVKKYRKHDIPRFCYVWNKIYRRSELERQGLIFKEGVLFEDIYFTIRFLYFSGSMVTVPGIIYHYWVNPNSITRTPNDKHQRDILAARADFINFSIKHNVICDERWYVKAKKIYKFCGIPLMKVYEWETIKKYYLFGLIPVFEKRIFL